MNDNKKSMIKSLILICILFILSGFTLIFYIGIPLLIASIYLLYKHIKDFNPIYKKGCGVEDLQSYKFDVEHELELQKKQAEKEIKDKQLFAEGDLNLINRKVETSKQELSKIQVNIETLQNELANLAGEIKVAYVSPYEFNEDITSEEYKNKLSILKTKYNEFIKSEDCIIFDKSTSAQSKRILNSDVKQLLRCFNAESATIISNVTAKNIDSCRSKMQKTYEALNKLFATDGISLHHYCLSSKLDELTLVYNYQIKIEQEKEQQRAIKEQMLEEEKVRREIEREKAKIEKEEKQFKNEIQKLMTYLQKASDIEKQLYVDKIKELEEKVKLLERDKENVLQREQNTRAGFVYIISNIGSFGENIYKIGMTRRLEPMDRVKELGDASVPFEFDVHAMIFSDDAPALENVLHKTFENNAVNKVNPRKEFFNVSLSEVEKVVKQHHNATVTFTEYAKAEQYRESLKLAQKN